VGGGSFGLCSHIFLTRLFLCPFMGSLLPDIIVVKLHVLFFFTVGQKAPRGPPVNEAKQK